MKLLIILIFIFSSSLFGFGRLDPHGKKKSKTNYKQIAKTPECKVCHEYSRRKRKYILIKNVSGSCNACHNKKPHAGMVEHTGKDLKKLRIGLKGKINCLSCHRPHRVALSKKQNSDFEDTMGEPAFIFLSREQSNNRDWESRKSIYPMLRRSCKHCHTKENLR